MSSPSAPALVRRSIGALVLLAAVGCASPAPTPSPPTATPPTAPPPTAAPTATAPPPEATLEPPPTARLLVGGAAFPGEVGSYTWAGGSDAAPWLPATALEPVRLTGRGATVAVEDGVAVATWTAVAAAADDPTAAVPLPLGTGEGGPAFRLPPPGEWVLSVRVVFAGGRGDAAWYWHLILR